MTASIPQSRNAAIVTGRLAWIALVAPWVTIRGKKTAPVSATPIAPPEREDLSALREYQADGQIAADLDPGLLQLALMGATLAPIAMPQVVRRITGLDPQDPGFRSSYENLLRRIVQHLAE